jgi:putative phosphoribosyl transferase
MRSSGRVPESVRRNITELSESKVLFQNRADAGRKLAAELTDYINQKVVVLAIPNGGVAIAVEVANALKADLEVIVVRKLALPLNPEGGLGAVADDGTSILNEDVISRDGLSREQIEYEAEKVKANVKQRSLRYMGEGPRSRLTGKTAVIVDDGLASGITMTVAVESVRHRRPKEIIVAVPVASATGYSRAAKVANRVVTCAVAKMPKFYLADFYHNWRDIGDDAVSHALDQWRQRHSL